MNEFDSKIAEFIPEGLHSDRIETIQINLGRRCNLACRHCHLECSPGRTEMMPWSCMEAILRIVRESTYRLVDITGGSPELHPDFQRLITALRDMGQEVQVRTNFTALLEPGLEGTMEFLQEKEVRLVGSLPCYLEENVRAQRGRGVYEKSIEVLRRLNELGYGVEERLPLNIVYNPAGPFLPGQQSELEKAYRRELDARFGICFNQLLVLTNMPIGRFRRELERSGKIEDYMRDLKNAFNPATLKHLMCRHQVCIDWDGKLYDCDFNLALGLVVNHDVPQTVEEFDESLLVRRKIITDSHCFGCTAGAGSSCEGVLM